MKSYGSNNTNANNMYSLILRKLQDGATQNEIANNLGIDPGNFSKLKNNQMEIFCQFLDTVNLKIVPKDAVLVNPEKLNALLFLFSGAINDKSLYNILVVEE